MSVPDFVSVLAGLFGMGSLVIGGAFYLAARQIKDNLLLKINQLELVELEQVRHALTKENQGLLKTRQIALRSQVKIGAIEVRLQDIENYLESNTHYRVRRVFPEDAVPDDTQF